MNKLSLRALCMRLCVLLLIVAASDALAQKDLMLVLDNSGSMRKNDPQFLARGAVAAFIDRLTADTRVGVLIFDQAVRVPVPLTSIDEGSKKKLTESLDGINYRGQLTDSPAAIERAIYELKTNGREGAEKIIVFITDGIVDTGNAEADVEKTKWLRDELAVDAQENAIKVFAIAFTEHADFFLIQSLAKKTNGEYYRALTPSDLAGVFDTVHAAISVPAAPPVAQPAPVEPPPTAPVELPTPPAPPPTIIEESGVVVTPIPEDKLESTLIPPDKSTEELLASLSEDELLALQDISEQTGIPIEQLAKELVGAPADAAADGANGPEPIIMRPDSEPTDEDVKNGAIVLGAAVVLLLLLVVLIVWFIRRRNNANPAAATVASGAVAPDSPPIPEAFINDINHYTDDPMIRLTEKPLMVGRVAGTDTQHLDYLVVNKGTVGRRHAIIKYKDYSFWIVDQGSVNGTYVNGNRLSGEQQLKHGDKISFHKYDFEFSQPEMDDGFHTVFADPNAAEATIVASAATLAATSALDLAVEPKPSTPSDEPDDLFASDSSAMTDPHGNDESPAAAFADADIFNVTGETEVVPASASAGDETMEETSTAIFDSPPEMSPPSDMDDDFGDRDTVIPDANELDEEDFGEDDDEEYGVEINLDTVGADDHPSLIFGSPSGQSSSEDFDADASAFFEDITVGPMSDSESGTSPGMVDDLFDMDPGDAQAALDAKLEQATAILDGKGATSGDSEDFGEMDTVAINDPYKPESPGDTNVDKFIETDSFDAPATIPPAHPNTAAEKESGDVTLEAFMSTSMFESGKVELTNEDETVLPAHVPDRPHEGDEDNPLAGDTVVLPGSPLARQGKRDEADPDDDSEDPTELK